MKEYTVNLGISEKASIPTSMKEDSSSPLAQEQTQFHQYTVHDLLYEHTPSYNGGYIIIVEVGPWLKYISLDKRLKDKYKASFDKYIDVANAFVMNSPKLAYQIEAGSVNINSDNYNLRHMNQNLFSNESKINSVSVTYLEEYNQVEFTHYLWIEFMKDLKKGFIKLPDEFKAKDTDIFYPVIYYGQIWAYSFDPVSLRPREIVKYVGVYPTNDNLSDSFGQRGQNNHYMKNISYNVVDFTRAVYPHTRRQTAGEDFNDFYKDSALFREFIDTSREYGILV